MGASSAPRRALPCRRCGVRQTWRPLRVSCMGGWPGRRPRRCGGQLDVVCSVPRGPLFFQDSGLHQLTCPAQSVRVGALTPPPASISFACLSLPWSQYFLSYCVRVLRTVGASIAPPAHPRACPAARLALRSLLAPASQEGLHLVPALRLRSGMSHQRQPRFYSSLNKLHTAAAACRS